MADLLPCPFCGGADVVADRRPLSRLSAVYCRDCEIAGPSGIGEEQAIATWNTRHDHMADLVEALTYTRKALGDPVPIGKRHIARVIDTALSRARNTLDLEADNG